MNDRARKLLQKARDSIHAAKVLQQEKHHDFAAARAYYAMFYAASAMLAEDGLSFSKHTAVHAEFGKRYAKTGRVPSELHRYLLAASETRHEADYEIETAVTAEFSAVHIERSE